MLDLVKFISVLVLITLLIFLSGARFLSLNGVNPNLLLIFFAGLSFAPFFREKMKLGYFSVLLLFSSIVGFFVFGLWIVQWAVLIAIVIALYFSKNLFTGRPLADFLMALGAGTAVFYAALAFISGGSFGPYAVLWEVVYNLALGTVFWIFLRGTEKFLD
jgi:hypothetical protein